MTQRNSITIEVLAAHYGQRVFNEQGKAGFRTKCPAHGGDNPTSCHVFASDQGRIAATCFKGCEPAHVMAAIERDLGVEAINPRGHSFQGTYAGGRDVWRVDRPDGSKSYPTRGTRDGVPLLVWGDEADSQIIIAEGEKAARAIQRAGFTAASYMGGSSSAGKADYSVVIGKHVLIWPDNDAVGFKAAEASAQAATAAGALSVAMLHAFGNEGSGADAADVPPEDLPERLATMIPIAVPWVPPAPEQPRLTDWGFVDLASLASLDPPEYAVPGMAVKGGVSILFAKSGDGKTTLIYAMLKAMTTGGPPFLGVDLPECPVLMFSEEPLPLIGHRVRDNGIPPTFHMVNTAAAIAKPPADFANEVYTEYYRHGGGFGMVLIDTLTSFANIQETNAYGEVGNAMRLMKQLAADLNTSVFLLHHRGKQSGDGNDGAIGSVSFVAQSDQRLLLNVRNEQRLLTVTGKYSTHPFPETVAFTVENGRADIIATRADLESDQVLAVIQGAETPINVKTIIGKMTDPPTRQTVQRRVAELIKQGDIREVEPSRGSVGATYEIANL